MSRSLEFQLRRSLQLTDPRARSYGAVGTFLADLREQVERPAVFDPSADLPEDDEPEICSLPEGSDEGEDAELAPDFFPANEEQARAAYHFEEGDNGDL